MLQIEKTDQKKDCVYIYFFIFVLMIPNVHSDIKCVTVTLENSEKANI